MKVVLAKRAGFCMGVRRAIEMVMVEANKKEGPLFTFGPLIHNRQVLDLLAAKGVKVADDLNGLKEGRILIRAHGIPPQERHALEETGLKVIDATCPKVTKVQAIIRHHTNKGYSAVIVGDPEHAEVIGLMGYSKTPAHVIQEARDVSTLPVLDKVFAVAQTTQNKQNYNDVVRALKEKFPDVLVFDTICEATQERQEEVRTFRGLVDAVVVVGGYHSGNTQRLAQISEEEGLPTFHVETDKDLDRDRLSAMEVIGLTAGASTPHWMIQQVLTEIAGIRGRREPLVATWVRRAFKFLVLSNLTVAAGAFSFSYAASLLSGRDPNLVFPFLASLYVYAMHIFNRFLDKDASAYSHPERAVFLRRYRLVLIMAGGTSLAIALVLAYIIGHATLLVLIGLSLLGIVYSLPLIPEGLRPRYRYSKIKDLPGSRSLSEALAWVAVISLLPILDQVRAVSPAVVIAALVVFSFSYAKAISFSIFQVQGDLMVGAETLPITLGEEKTLLILRFILATTAIILIGGPILGVVEPFSFLMLLPLFTLSFCLWAYEKRWLYPGIPLEALIESNFLMSGLLAVIWQY